MCRRRGCRGERETRCYMQRDRWSVCSRSDERRRTGTSGKEEGGIGRHLPSETKKMEGENVHGGGQRQALRLRNVTLRHQHKSPDSLAGAVVPWWDSNVRGLLRSGIPNSSTCHSRILWALESFSLCNPLVPGVLLILESYWFRNTFGFQNPYDSRMRGYNPIPRKERGGNVG